MKKRKLRLSFPKKFQINSKKGEILVENVIFIILNLIFLAILILFIFRQGNGLIFLEESYAKQIALLIDSAKPNMVLKLNIEEAKKLAEENGIEPNEIVKINNNIVAVKLSENSGYFYSFFNDVGVNHYLDGDSYIFIINEKNAQKT